MTSYPSSRLRRHLLYRLGIDARQRAVETAIDRGILAHAGDSPAGAETSAPRRTRRRPVEVKRHGVIFYGDEDTSDTVIRRIKLGPLLAGRERPEAVAILERLGIDGNVADPEQTGAWSKFARTGSGCGPSPVRAHRRGSRTISADEVLAAVEAAAVPLADHLAAVLLIADAIEARGPNFEAEVRRALRSRSWMAVIRSPVTGFAPRLRRMVADAALGHPISTLTERDLTSELTQVPERMRGQRNLILIRGKDDLTDVERKDREKQTAIAARLGVPVLGIAEGDEELPARIVHAVDIVIDTGSLTSAILGTVIGSVVGATPVDLAKQLPDAACARLSISDLPAAIRPGRSAHQVIAALRAMAGIERAGDALGGHKESRGGGRGKGATGKATSGERGRNGRTVTSGSERIDPAPADPSADVGEGAGQTSDTPSAFAPTALRIETLHGYGEARAWAIDLGRDLRLWHEGDLPWSQMSTRLLLSGPPGTGKTTFARALCNSLQVPLFATSVSNWLEPSNLGDVIRRMRLAFKEAVEHAPSILFVDEIDGIGSRGERNEYSDYWNSVVNKLLELLDGASKSEGVVIVGATNNPAIIDPAIRRSGRLETHIEIPLPDVEALIGILAHHIGPDMAGMTAPDGGNGR